MYWVRRNLPVVNALSSGCLVFLVIGLGPFLTAFGGTDLSEGVLIADRWGEGVAGLEDEAGGAGVEPADDTNGLGGTTVVGAEGGAASAAICTS